MRWADRSRPAGPRLAPPRPRTACELPNTYELLTGGKTLAEVWQPVEENLWVAPSHIDLAAAEVELAGVVGRELILRDALAANVAEQGTAANLDLVLMDCPPSLGILTINALSTVDDGVFLPLQPPSLFLRCMASASCCRPLIWARPPPE